MFDIHRHVRVTVDRSGVIRRRDFLKGISVASLAAGTLNWSDLVATQASELRRRGMACILLWMKGGPSQFETFDPKPGHPNGGDTKVISTALPGIQIAETFPYLAQTLDQIALIRSMTTKEGNHQRASFLLHTGYNPTASVKHPTLGSIAAQQLPNPECELPAFVRIANGRRGTSGGGGFLGVEYDPFGLAVAGKLPDNTTPATATDRYQRRLGLLSRLEADYASDGAAQLVADHQKLYGKAARMIMSKEMQAFDISHEPQQIRDAYGSSEFASGCLLARRLIESGVTCVEIECDGWDTHQDNFERTRELAGKVDQPFAHLLRDLKDRGLAETTLVVWMGEFGRTPRVNGRVGRDHYPKAFNVALSGAGIKGGQVIGATNPGGEEVVDRPVTVSDLFQSICHALKIDPNTENMSPIGRPIKIVEGGQLIPELFG